PDIVVMGKGMGGGLPIGAFSASQELMCLLEDQPKLGHITTFGGNPLIAAAALATLREIRDSSLMDQIAAKENLIRTGLEHPQITEIRGTGLMLAPLFKNEDIVNKIIFRSIEKGLMLFWLLWEKKAIRITPPLTISHKEIKKGCRILRSAIDEVC
ncbi:MAG: aminotransferase class III-fold pyridoxal phosphate-dependent enzyme, partial [Flavobacteriia bacterium]|nr:aminotransferase class III-fold pyridoxal phosphate-dependent enzyme [Flavobacteriia bacterium]